jgi:hypothetical protein
MLENVCAGIEQSICFSEKDDENDLFKSDVTKTNRASHRVKCEHRGNNFATNKGVTTL